MRRGSAAFFIDKKHRKAQKSGPFPLRLTVLDDKIDNGKR